MESFTARCPPVCAIYCPFGNVMDKNGCPTCTCKPNPNEAMNCGEKDCGTGEICIEDNIECVKEPCNKNPRCELRNCERCAPDEKCVFETVSCKRSPCPKFAKCIQDDLCKKCKSYETCRISQPFCVPGLMCPKPKAHCELKNPCMAVKCGFGKVCVTKPSEDCNEDDEENCRFTAECVDSKPSCAALTCPMNYHCKEQNGIAVCVPDPLCVKAGCRKDQTCVIITPGCLPNRECPTAEAQCHDISNKPSCADLECLKDQYCEIKEGRASCQNCPVFKCKECPPGQKYLRDKRGCKSCQCQPKIKTCKDIKCNSDEHCEMSVTCFGSNCPPAVPKCVRNIKETCNQYHCRDGQYCEMSIVCMAIGCPPSVPICRNCPVYKCKPCADNEQNVPDKETGCPTCKCAPKKVCPAIECANFCQNGYKIENGCKTCTCNLPPPPPTCQNFRCADPGTECQLIPTPCPAPPEECRNVPDQCNYYCYPQPACVKKQTCDTQKCPPGTKCVMKEVQCVTAPCPSLPTCIGQ